MAPRPRRSALRRGAKLPGRFRGSFRARCRAVTRRREPITVRVQGVKASRRTCASTPRSAFRTTLPCENTRAMRDSVRALLPAEFRKAQIELYTDNREVSEPIPLACRDASQVRRLVEKRKLILFTNRSRLSERPLVTCLSTAARRRPRTCGTPYRPGGRATDAISTRRRTAGGSVRRSGRPAEDLYTQSWRAAVPGSDARKRRGVRAASARTRRSATRCWRITMPGNGNIPNRGLGTRRCGLCPADRST